MKVNDIIMRDMAGTDEWDSVSAGAAKCSANCVSEQPTTVA